MLSIPLSCVELRLDFVSHSECQGSSASRCIRDQSPPKFLYHSANMRESVPAVVQIWMMYFSKWMLYFLVAKSYTVHSSCFVPALLRSSDDWWRRRHLLIQAFTNTARSKELEGINFPYHISNQNLVGLISLLRIGKEVRIASLSRYCRVKLKSLNRKFSLTEISLLQGQHLAGFIKFYMRKRRIGGGRCLASERRKSGPQ